MTDAAKGWEWVARTQGFCVAVGSLEVCAALPISAREGCELAARPVSSRGSVTFCAARGLARQVRCEWEPGVDSLDVLSAPSGAPVCRDPSLQVGVTHDGEWVAVGWSRVGGLGVDLCSAQRVAKASAVLSRLQLAVDAPLAAWAALEATLKLRGQGITALLSAELELVPGEGGLVVNGLGEPVHCSVRAFPGFSLAWAVEAAPCSS